jgi:hypothetical protein
MIFQTSKVLQCKFWSNARPHCVDRGAFGACAQDKTEEKKRLSARCAPVGGNTRAPASKSPGRKIRIDFSPISDELTVNQVGRGRFVNLQVSEIKRKANEAQMREEFIPSPQYGRQSVCTLFVAV